MPAGLSGGLGDVVQMGERQRAGDRGLDQQRIEPEPAQTGGHHSSVYVHPDRHDEIIAFHLRRLTAAREEQLGHNDMWFVRYRTSEDTDHLRVRVRSAPGAWATAAEQVGIWVDELRRERSVHGLRLDIYHPEVGRYGHGSAMAAAERVFVTDSRVASEALAGYSSDSDEPSRTAVTVASMCDIAVAFLGSADAAASWFVRRPPQHQSDGAARPERATIDEAIAFGRRAFTGDPNDRHPGSDAHQSRAAALRDYRGRLPEHLHPDAVLASLLHMHHNRVVGIDTGHEAICLRTARYAALSWTTLRPQDRP